MMFGMASHNFANKDDGMMLEKNGKNGKNGKSGCCRAGYCALTDRGSAICSKNAVLKT
jgi:hypothetical protein